MAVCELRWIVADAWSGCKLLLRARVCALLTHFLLCFVTKQTHPANSFVDFSSRSRKMILINTKLHLVSPIEFGKQCCLDNVSLQWQNPMEITMTGRSILTMAPPFFANQWMLLLLWRLVCTFAITSACESLSPIKNLFFFSSCQKQENSTRTSQPALCSNRNILLVVAIPSRITSTKFSSTVDCITFLVSLRHSHTSETVAQRWCGTCWDENRDIELVGESLSATLRWAATTSSNVHDEVIMKTFAFGSRAHADGFYGFAIIISWIRWFHRRVRIFSQSIVPKPHHLSRWYFWHFVHLCWHFVWNGMINAHEMPVATSATYENTPITLPVLIF